MKVRWFLLPLVLLQSAWAEKVESTELKFAATVPAKMRQARASNASGKTTSFEGKDAATGFTYQILVDQGEEAAKAAAGADLLKPTLERILRDYTASVKASGAGAKTEWKKGFSKDVLFFDFEAAGHLPGGERSSHSGVKFLHHDSIFTVQVIAPGEGRTEDTRKALLAVMGGFSLLN